MACGVTLLLLLGYRMLVPPDSIPAALADAAFEREVAVAEALGLAVTEDERVTTSEAYLQTRVAVPAGACVAVVATASGGGQLKYLHLSREYESVSVDDRLRGLAAHVQTCVDQATTLDVSMYAEHQEGVFGRPVFSRAEIHYAVLVGQPEGGPAALNRGNITPFGAGSMSQREVLRAADAWVQGRTPRGPALRIRPFRARLVPETTGSYDALRELARNGRTISQTLSPHIDRLPASVQVAWGALPAAYESPEGALSTPAMAFEASIPVRVLAVIDGDALPLCVDVRLVRMSWGASSWARRYRAPREQREANFMTDRVCEGRVVYVTDAGDQTDYQLQLYAEDIVGIAGPPTDAEPD